MVWVQAVDVIDAWIGDDAPTDTALVGVWVSKAERLIRSEVLTIQSRIDSGVEPDLLENVRDVVIDMVIRKFRNPEGLRQVSDNTGPFGSSRTYGGDEPGALYISDSELRKISGDVLVGGAFSVSMIPATSPFAG